MTMRIIFSNTTGEFAIQTANQNYSFKATSGRDECMNNKDCEDKPYTGPTPKGAYYIIADKLNDPNSWEDAGRAIAGGIWKRIGNVNIRKPADWGDFRIEMYPQADTNTHGRSKMFLHGGTFDGSAGCIDVGGWVFGDKNSDKIKELIKAHAAQGVIRVDVINGRILEFHKNQPKDVVLPKELISKLPNHTTIADDTMQFFAEYTSTERYKNFEIDEKFNETLVLTEMQKKEIAENEKEALLNSNYYTKPNEFGITQAFLDEAKHMTNERLEQNQSKNKGLG